MTGTRDRERRCGGVECRAVCARLAVPSLLRARWGRGWVHRARVGHAVQRGARGDVGATWLRRIACCTPSSRAQRVARGSESAVRASSAAVRKLTQFFVNCFAFCFN